MVEAPLNECSIFYFMFDFAISEQVVLVANNFQNFCDCQFYIFMYYTICMESNDIILQLSLLRTFAKP